ncbi:hypothetical protein BX666DRAFT_1977013 [Dichotomocladium elegans]|nr:hypothetical protein BX666DRAFT_1977013 [Dichotomocladium elegans]
MNRPFSKDSLSNAQPQVGEWMCTGIYGGPIHPLSSSFAASKPELKSRLSPYSSLAFSNGFSFLFTPPPPVFPMAEGGEREPLLGQPGQRYNSEDVTVNPHDNVEPPQHHEQDPDSRYLVRRFSLLEKILFAISVTFLIILCILVGFFARRVYGDGDHDKAPNPSPTSPPGGPGDGKNDTKPELCLSAGCVLAAAEILKDIDMTVDPCEDFYAYTCNHDLPIGKSRLTSFELLSTANKEILHKIFKSDFETFHEQVFGKSGELPDPDKLLDKQNFKKAKNLFDSCMDEDRIDSLGADPIIQMLHDIRESYPALRFLATEAGEFEEADSEDPPQQQQLTNVYTSLAKTGVNPFFALLVEADPKDPERISLQIFQDGFTLPSKEYYEQEEYVDALFLAVSRTMDIVFRDYSAEFGWNRWSANITARQVVDLERRLASVSDTVEYLQDPEKTYNPRTLSQLASSAPAFDWGLLVSHLLPANAPHQDTLVVSSPRYLEKLSTEIIPASQPRAIQAYLLWRAINTYAFGLSEEVRQPLKELSAKLSGTNPKMTKPRWETCLGYMDESLGFLVGRYFSLKKFSEDAQTRAEEFVNSIKNSFVDRLPELEWLDDETREKALDKVDMLVRKVGYPTNNPDTMSPISISEYYSELSMSSDDFFGNSLRTAKWQVAKEWRQVGTTPDRTRWLMNPQEVNAYFNPPFNEIVFPAGILQSPFFSNDVPDYLNYGGIGVVVGHELTHGYDNMGRLYDGRGRLIDWWTNETSKAFNDKAQCFVDQYSNFTIEDEHGEALHLNGHLTLGENLADNGGLRQSFVAWKARYENNQGENRLLPGLEDLTPEKLFFINYGRVWCSIVTPAQARQRVLTDPHSPGKWRTIGAVQNSRYFAEVFNCPVGSPMNPDSKCELW